MAKTYRCEIEVRGYELDSYEHVNHAVYFNYLEHARWRMLQEEGITFDKLEQWKRWPVIAEAHAKYLKPTFMGDRLDVKTSVVEHTRSSFTFGQTIYRGDTAVFEARMRVVIVDEAGRPAKPPEELTRLWAISDDGGAD